MLTFFNNSLPSASGIFKFLTFSLAFHAAISPVVAKSSRSSSEDDTGHDPFNFLDKFSILTSPKACEMLCNPDAGLNKMLNSMGNMKQEHLLQMGMKNNPEGIEEARQGGNLDEKLNEAKLAIDEHLSEGQKQMEKLRESEYCQKVCGR